jgi:hypothetical protein
VPLALETWPPQPGEVEQVLGEALSGLEDGAEIDLVLVNEASSDPQRVTLLTALGIMYRVREEWYGLLHRLTYVTGPEEVPLDPVGAVFEGGIALEGVTIVDPTVEGGGTVRLVMSWRSPVEVRDSFSVFVHLVDAEGKLWAQADSIPGGGLLPMTAWRPGEPIVDRFAVSLPPDTPPGEYTVRVGIYNPTNSLRLPLLEGNGGGDYAIIGVVRVR